MNRAIAVHSYKGGTGKTIISANMAVLYAKKGSNVCLLDYDFRAPSLSALFRVQPRFWLNDFLNGECNIKEVLTELSYGTKGKLFVGFANPSTVAIRDMMSKSREWEMQALHKILSAKTTLHKDLEINHIIFDTSPGIYYSSLNALATSDAVMLVMKFDEFDVQGTVQLIQGIYDILGRKTGILLNKVLASGETLMKIPVERREEIASQAENLLKQPILGVIPCYCDVLFTGGKLIHAIQKPNHPLITTLLTVMKELEKL